MSVQRIKIEVNYEDPYVQPLIIEALRSQLPTEVFDIAVSDTSTSRSKDSPLLQWKSYETVDFDHALEGPSKQLINAYIIRKALIRKHYLSHTVHAWVVKNPSSSLQRHFKPAVDFELDYAEFLDEALVEAFELRESFKENESLGPHERQWWILKPGMSDRGQGIRLFSTESELTDIFEAWEAEQPDSDDEEEAKDSSAPATGPLNEGIVTSHLRHFVAQPYIHPPLLTSESPFNNRKFHIRTYVVASGALQVYVYEHMLALFASETYQPPWATFPSRDMKEEPVVNAEDMLQRMRDVHLSNTCVQSATPAEKAASVHLVSSLPFTSTMLDQINSQIRSTTADLFRAALAQPVNFQALPQAFEIFGLDFLVEDQTGGEGQDVKAWLLEVNAFPDFAQTGDDLRDKVVKGLFEDVVRTVVGPYFGVSMGRKEGRESTGGLIKVLDTETGLK